MPLEHRVIEPICVSRATLPLDAQGSLAISIPNELECVTNGSLANVIRQLSSLSRYAEDVFSGIIKETGSLIGRTTCLQGRIDRLSIRVTQLDSAVEEISIHDIHLKKPFKSNTAYDQQVMNRNTMPQSLMDQYKLCDKPPPLSKLNQYRDDNKDGLKFYTDPTYFFELWRQEMLQMTERESRIKQKGLHHRVNSKSSASSANGILPASSTSKSDGQTVSRQKRPRQPCNTRERYQMQAAQQEFLPIASNATAHHHQQQHQDHMLQMDQQQHQQNGGLYQSPGAYGTMQHHRPNSLEINQYTENPYGVHQHLQQANRQSSSSSSSQQMQQQHQQMPDYGYAGQAQMHNNHHQQQQQQQNYHSSKITNDTPYGHPAHHQTQAPQTPPTLHHNNNNSNNNNNNPQLTPTRRGNTPNHHRPSQPPPAPPSNPSSGSSSGPGTPTAGTPSRGNSRGTSVNREVLPPPPPPPPPMPAGPGQFDLTNGSHHAAPADHRISSSSDQSLPPPPPMPTNNNNTSGMIAKTNGQPPPPPPMPLNADSYDRPDGGPASVPSFAQQILAKQSQLQPAAKSKHSASNRLLPQHHVVNDARSGLLQAIREGIKLRRVEDSKTREAEKAAPCNDVASILARRVPQELSDSDSDDHSGFESDAWEDS